MTLRIAWFATARGGSSRKLLNAANEAIREGRLDAEIVCVVCNRVRGQSANTDRFLDDVDSAGIPLISSSSLEWRRRVGGEISVPGRELASWRRDFDRHLYRQMLQHSPDVGMLAGYMLVITDVICDQLPCINLHPALPDGPIGTWQQVIHELIARQADRSGMVLQRVTTELDRGPTVTWAEYPIRGPLFDPLWAEHGDDSDSETPLFHAIREAGASREPAFILKSLQAIAAQDSVATTTNDIGLDITAAVESEVDREGS
ncbi:MAG: formyltransferase family protein [Chloroflexota bacterium]|nr:formyltransferase family protein [Chloroflexota bacterium]